MSDQLSIPMCDRQITQPSRPTQPSTLCSWVVKAGLAAFHLQSRWQVKLC